MSMYKLADTIIKDFTTHNPSTGAVSDADSTPTVEVFEDDNDTPILTPTPVKRTVKTGDYRVSIAATGGNGFEVGKWYNVVVTATVNAITGKATVMSFTLTANDIDDVDAVADTIAAAATEARLAELDAANLPTDIADIPTVAEFNARTLLAADYVVVSDTIAGVTTVTNLTNAPTAGDLTATMKASVNAEADTALSDYDPPTKAELDSGLAALNDPTAGAVADAVWDEPIVGHVGAGSFGAKNQKVVPSETANDYKADVSGLATTANQTTILNRLGAWTGTGINTILGAFTAIFSKVASKPSDITGTGDPTTDSLEAIRDTAPLGSSMRGTDSAALAANYTAGRATYLDNLSAGAVATASALTTVSGLVDDLESRLTAVRAGYLDELGPTNIPADVDMLLTRITAVVATASALSTAQGNITSILEDTGTTIPATLTTVEGKIDIIDTNVDAILVDTGTTLNDMIVSIYGRFFGTQNEVTFVDPNYQWAFLDASGDPLITFNCFDSNGNPADPNDTAIAKLVKV